MEVCTIGGFEEVGKNMTAVKTGEDVFIFDAGLYIPGIVELQDEGFQKYAENDLRKFGAIPDDRVLDELGWSKNVVAIIISHAHLDHIGSVPYIAKRYPNAKIYGTPFTMQFLEAVLEDEKITLNNKRIVVHPDSAHFIKGKSDNYRVDFIHTTHSTIQCVFPALHTREGVFFYALDLKFDNYPTLGKPPTYYKMKELGKKGIKVMVIDALYSRTEKKPGSEKIAAHLLEEAFSNIHDKNSAIFVTTFSSHIERLMNIVNMAKRTNRQIIFLGRSLAKYVGAATKVKQCPFVNQIKILKYRRQVNSFLNKLEKERGKYVVVCTGHQAEEGSILDRISKGETPFSFKPGDHLLFSSSVIPISINILAREKMDSRFRRLGVKIQTDIHVHGHGSRDDMRELIRMTKPKHIIPAHGSLEQEAPLVELAKEFGYKLGETSHLCSDGKVLEF
ncbi:MBL fold metallo-hydrolase [Candidatus Pacearchaeota archaeon]|nr:MBL fold metallo-hydrolase [Candidatus Pacearchaeota archaeon]